MLPLLAAESSALAQLIWDPAGNRSASGGSGTWNLGPWYTGSSDVAWIPGSNATFQGTGGTVSLAAPVLVGNIILAPSSNGYTITGSNALEVFGENFSSTIPTIVNNGNNTIEAPMSGGGRLNIAGSGTLNLTGSSVFGYAGGSLFYQYSGNLVISGTGSVTQINSGNYDSTDIGSGSNSTASLTLKDSANYRNNNGGLGDFNLGDSPAQITGNTATVNVQDNAVLQTNNLYIGKGNNTGIMNVSGGTVTVTMIVNGGTYTVSGGTMAVGDNYSGAAGVESVGVYNQTGGLLISGSQFFIGNSLGMPARRTSPAQRSTVPR